MAITRIQSTTASGNSVSTLNVVFGAAPTKGNILLVAAMNSAAGSTCTMRPNSSANITWTVYCSINGSGGTLTLAVGRVITSSASATVGLAFDAARPTAAVGVEYSGLNITPDLQTTGSGNNTVTIAATPGNVNFNNELVILAGGLQGQWAATNSHTYTQTGTCTGGSVVAQINTNNNTAGGDRACGITECFPTTTIGNSPGIPSMSNTSGQWAALYMSFGQSVAGLRLAGHGGLAA